MLSTKCLVDVSVIIPCWNEEPEDLQETVDSVVASCEESGLIYEVLVIDDGSDVAPNPSGATVASFPHAGIPSALNRGWALSQGQRLCVVSAGDGFYLEKVRAQWCEMVASAAAASVHAYDNAKGEHVRAGDAWERDIWNDCQFCLSTMMIDADMWAAVRGFDEDLLWCSDWDFAAKVQECEGWLYIDYVLGHADEHPGGHTDRGMGTKERDRCRAKVAKRYSKQERMKRAAGHG
jgi:glycosyltransferase involved in cell wall biosynthesis